MEIANTNANEEARENVALEEGVVDSSSTEEVKEGQGQSQEDDLSKMSQEELVDFARKEREAKQRAVAHLRDQSKKHRPNIEAIDKEEPKLNIESEAELEERIARIVDKKANEIVAKRLQEQPIDDFTKGASDWLMEQPWATPFLPETFGSDPLYAKLFTEVKHLKETHPVNNIEDYRQLLKLAAVNVTGKPDALLGKSNTLDYQRSMSTSPRVSTGQASKRIFTAEEIAFAKACGHKPEEVYK